MIAKLISNKMKTMMITRKDLKKDSSQEHSRFCHRTLEGAGANLDFRAYFPLNLYLQGTHMLTPPILHTQFILPLTVSKMTKAKSTGRSRWLQMFGYFFLSFSSMMSSFFFKLQRLAFLPITASGGRFYFWARISHLTSWTFILVLSFACAL